MVLQQPCAYVLYLLLYKKAMNNHHEQMPVRYKQLGSGQGTDLHFESSLDLIFSPGCFTVEIEHSGKDVGLPIDYCGEEHYFVGSLVVTDSGTAGHKQKNRVTGQILTITLHKPLLPKASIS